MKYLLTLVVLIPMISFADEATDWRQTQAQESIAASLKGQNTNANSYYNSPLAAEQQRENFELKLMLAQIQVQNAAQAKAADESLYPLGHFTETMSFHAFASIVKKQYPDYKDVDDYELASLMVRHYPVYKPYVQFNP
jgi:hypothetical protein